MGSRICASGQPLGSSFLRSQGFQCSGEEDCLLHSAPLHCSDISQRWHQMAKCHSTQFYSSFYIQNDRTIGYKLISGCQTLSLCCGIQSLTCLSSSHKARRLHCPKVNIAGCDGVGLKPELSNVWAHFCDHHVKNSSRHKNSNNKL